MDIILVADFAPKAASEENGFKLRNRIQPILEKGDSVLLDFTNIIDYSTMFFNASIGYIISKNSPKVLEKIKFENMTNAGNIAFTHSVDNAKRKYNEGHWKV